MFDAGRLLPAHQRASWALRRPWSIGVHVEGGYAFIDPIGSQGTLDEGSHERVLVGIDYTFSFQLYFLIEYLRLGRGAARAEEITLSDRMAYLTGETIAVDRDTLFVGLSYPIADLVELAVYAIVGLNDPSAVINPWLVVDVTSGLKLSVTAFVPVGNESSQVGRSGVGGFVRLRFSY